MQSTRAISRCSRCVEHGSFGRGLDLADEAARRQRPNCHPNGRSAMPFSIAAREAPKPPAAPAAAYASRRLAGLDEAENVVRIRNTHGSESQSTRRSSPRSHSSERNHDLPRRVTVRDAHTKTHPDDPEGMRIASSYRVLPAGRRFRLAEK